MSGENGSAAAATEPWRCPRWMSWYQRHLVGFRPEELEALMNATKTRDVKQATEAMMAECQVKLLIRLMEAGALLAPRDRAPRKASECL